MTATVGRRAPDFELLTTDGLTFRLSELRGKAVLLYFWATWCQPCKIQMPWLVEFQNAYGDEGFQVVAVALDDASTEEVSAFARQMGVNYPILIGNDSVAKRYNGVDVLPTTFYINRNRRLVAREFGLESRDVMAGHIKQALGQLREAQK